MRVEAGQHAADGRFDQLGVVGLFDVVAADPFEDVAKQIELAVGVRGRRPRAGRRRERPSVIRRIGFIVNPIAGLGGSLALKGTDSPDVVRRALERGAEPVARARAARAIARLSDGREDVSVVAAAAPMGADLLPTDEFRREVVGAQKLETTGDDTRNAAAEMERRGVELILYAGGDGTTRDIVDAIGTRVPILGIPTGVKMHSATFATSPEAAADVVLAHLRTRRPRTRQAEVMDVDEDALRAGVVAARLYGAATVPDDRMRVQHPKARSSGDGGIEGLSRAVACETRGLTLFGPGTTTRRVLRHLGIDGTLLGVDAVDDGRLVGRDLDADGILELLASRAARLVIGVVGGQGYVFGRGNQQLTPAVIRRIGVERIDIIAAADKLYALEPRVLRVDTGDPELDALLAGFRRVRVDARRFLVLPITA